MRTANSIKNSMTSLILSVITMLVGFVSRAIFIKLLGVEYLGLNGLFSNILSMLSIFELGIGNAIVYNLYKPIANNEYEDIKSIMKFYKYTYLLIAIIIFVFGIFLIPFLDFFVSDVSVSININIVYFLFLLNTVFSYILSYKRSIIYAYQKNYIINIIHIMYVIFLNIIQLLMLYFTKNYYLYLGVLIVCQLLENIFISFIANRIYPFLKEKNIVKMNKNTKNQIFKKVKALFFHKIGEIVVLGTDNIIISKFFGVIVVGLYSNYLIIFNAVSSMISQIINSTVASIGNLLVLDNSEKSFEVFKKIRFVNFWLATFTGICILLLIQPFVTIWIGKECLLSMPVIFVLILNYYQKMMRRSFGVFKDASGTWEEDKFIPLIESIANIVVSIICLKLFGLSGVFMGTIISGLILWCYSYPKFVYKKLFNRSYIDFIKETLGYILLFVMLAFGTFYFSTVFVLNNVWIELVVYALIAFVVPNVILLLLFWKTDEFKYFLNLTKNILGKLINKEN